MWKRATVSVKSTSWTGFKVHFTETCETNQPHLIVEVTTTAATLPDGEIMGELHEHLAQQEMLPGQHLVDTGYVDAEVLAESQSRYQVDLVGPVPPDVSWQTKEATGFDHRQFMSLLASPSGDMPNGADQPKLGHDSRSPWQGSHPSTFSASGLSGVSFP